MRACFMHSERLGFGTWAASDLPLARALWGDDRVTRLIGGPFTDEAIRERLEREMASQQDFGYQYWPLFTRPGGRHVGCCGLRPRREADVPELGFHFRPEYWGRGYAAEAARAVVAHAFGVLGVRALFAGHHPANDASRRLLERLGFRFVSQEYYTPTGLLHPSYVLERTAFTGPETPGSP